MSDPIITGIFTLVGVIIGGIMSLITGIYIQNKTHSNDIQNIKKEIILKRLSSVIELIKHLPSNNEDYYIFREYYLNEYSKAFSRYDEAREIIYLSNDMKQLFDNIDKFADNIEFDDVYDGYKYLIETYKNVLIKIAQDELHIKLNLLQTKIKDKKTYAYYKQEANNFINYLKGGDESSIEYEDDFDDKDDL